METNEGHKDVHNWQAINPQFKDLLKQRQMAYASGSLEPYKHLRNKANTVNRNLRGHNYQTKIEELKSTLKSGGMESSTFVEVLFLAKMT